MELNDARWLLGIYGGGTDIKIVGPFPEKETEVIWAERLNLMVEGFEDIHELSVDPSDLKMIHVYMADSEEE